MKYCKHCGKEMDDLAVVCPNCGVQQELLTKDPDTGSVGWGILGCCLPIAGLILFLVWREKSPKPLRWLVWVH